MTSHDTVISWHEVLSSESVHYENASSEDFHQLKLDYSVTGLLEIGVIFMSDSCTKSSLTQYTGKCRVSLHLLSSY